MKNVFFFCVENQKNVVASQNEMVSKFGNKFLASTHINRLLQLSLPQLQNALVGGKLFSQKFTLRALSFLSFQGVKKAQSCLLCFLCGGQ